MTALLWLIPVALGLGLLGLVAFFWTLRSGQYNDLDGAAHRILMDDGDRPLPDQRAATADPDGEGEGEKS